MWVGQNQGLSRVWGDHLKNEEVLVKNKNPDCTGDFSQILQKTPNRERIVTLVNFRFSLKLVNPLIK
jgi:hypothetical protein